MIFLLHDIRHKNQTFNCLDSSVNTEFTIAIHDDKKNSVSVYFFCSMTSAVYTKIICVTTTAKWAVSSAYLALNVPIFGVCRLPVSVSVCETHTYFDFIYMLNKYLYNCTICVSHQRKMHDNRKCHTEKPWLRLVWLTHIRSIYVYLLVKVYVQFSNDNMEKLVLVSVFRLKSSPTHRGAILKHYLAWNVQVGAYVTFCKQGNETWQRVVRCNDLFVVG